MGLVIPHQLYRIKHNPVNRKQKRIAQKEMDKIQRECWPVIFAYAETKEKTDSLRLLARDKFIRHAKVANKGNIFVEANLFFFQEFFPTKENIEKIVKPRRSQKYAAFAIVAVILIIIALLLVLK